MKHTIVFYALLVPALVAASCSRRSPVPASTAAWGSQFNSFSCKVDGQLFEAYAAGVGNNYKMSVGYGEARNPSDTTERSYEVYGTRIGTAYNDPLKGTLDINIYNCRGVGRYAIDGRALWRYPSWTADAVNHAFVGLRPPGYQPSPYDTVNLQDQYSFSTTPRDTGSITIEREQTDRDSTGKPTRYRVLGSFAFTARNRSGKTVQITEGRFYRDSWNSDQ